MPKIRIEDFQSESDANILAEYEQIMMDNERKRKAINAAKKKANELNKRADAMNRVCSKGSNKGKRK